MTKERLQQILGNLIDWASMHDPEFFRDFINAARLQSWESYELGVDLYDDDPVQVEEYNINDLDDIEDLDSIDMEQFNKYYKYSMENKDMEK